MGAVSIVRLGSKSDVTVVLVGGSERSTVVQAPSRDSTTVIPVGDVGSGSSGGPILLPNDPTTGVPVIPVETGYTPYPGERWWRGEGPPPEVIPGARVGDWYWSTDTGLVYELDPGP